MQQPLDIARDANGCARITLNRPEVHNAFDDALIGQLTEVFRTLDADDSVHVVVLTGAGRSFSSGADLNWMRSMAGYSEAENVADALRLAEMLHTLDRLGKPTIARVNGHAFGGAVGLISACDIVLAVQDAKFALSEARLGLAPAVISPFVIAAIGARQARRYFLTGERFDAGAACSMGLVHAVVPPEALDEALERQLELLRGSGPAAQRACKRLIAHVAQDAADPELADYTARVIAELRASDEGQEGIGAFLAKRPPQWPR